MYNQFLLQRTLVKRLRVDPSALVRVARILLSAILLLCGKRHRIGAYASDLPWLVGCRFNLLKPLR